MSSYFQEVGSIFNSVTLCLVASGNSQISRRIKPDSTFNVKQPFTHKGDCSKVIEYVYLWRRIVIEIVSDRSGKLRNRTTIGSRAVVGRPAYVETSADDAHVSHWTNSELLVAPAIGIHRAEVAESQIAGSIEICDKRFAAESKTPTETGGAVPGSLRVTGLKFVLTVWRSVRKTKF